MTTNKRSDQPSSISDADRALIDEAASAFALDHRYLEAILWAAQARKPASKK